MTRRENPDSESKDLCVPAQLVQEPDVTSRHVPSEGIQQHTNSSFLFVQPFMADGRQTGYSVVSAAWDNMLFIMTPDIWHSQFKTHMTGCVPCAAPAGDSLQTSGAGRHVGEFKMSELW